MKRRTLALITAALLITATPAAAHADTVDPQITAAVASVPGGQIVDDHTAYWPSLTMTLTVPDPRLRDAVGSCANGSVCAYSGAALTGSKLSWTTCSTFSTTALGAPVRSIADARSTGNLQARNGTTVAATASAQSWASVAGTTDNVKCN
jgi:hypothetical protein